MDAHTSLQNCTRYGFQEGDRTFFSNMPEEFLRAWRDRLDTSPEAKSRLNGGGNVAFINREQPHLDHIVGELVLDSLGQHKRRKIPSDHDRYSHHTTKSFIDVWEFEGLPLYGERTLSPQVRDAAMSNGLIKLVYGRIKARDSGPEKETRLNAAWEMMGYSSNHPLAPLDQHLAPFHVVASDIVALTVVGETETTCRELKEEIDANSLVQTLGPANDYFGANHKGSGYTSLHQYYAWMGDTIPAGTIFEIHYETLAAHPLNMHGNGDKTRAHKFHSDRKFKAPHYQGDNKIIIIEKNLHDPGELKVTPVDNGFAQYLLID